MYSEPLPTQRGVVSPPAVTADVSSNVDVFDTADGLSVVVNFASNADRANEVVDEIVAARGTATAIGADVADELAMAGCPN